MHNDPLTPSIRFSGFTDAWERRKLGDFCTEVTRRDAESAAPIMMISASSGFIEQSEKYSSDNAGQSLEKYILLKRGELAYNHGASKLRKYGSCFALNIDEARVPFVYHCFDVGDNNSNFTAMILNVPQIDNQLRRLVSSGARMDGLLNISFDAYKTVEIKLPCRGEQDKIEKLLNSLDRLITLHQRKYEKLVNVKKSMLEKMFPKNDELVPEIRFAGFTNTWERRKVRDVCSNTYGGGTPATANPVFWNGTIPWIQSSDLTEHKLNIGTPRKHITEEAIHATPAKLIPKDSLAIITRVGVGKLAVMPFSYTTSQDFLSLSNLNIDLDFGAYSLYKKLQSELDKVQGTSIKGITKDELLNKLISVPTREEQSEIGKFFSELDRLITLHQRKLERLQNIKKSFLEKMFV